MLDKIYNFKGEYFSQIEKSFFSILTLSYSKTEIWKIFIQMLESL